MAYIYWENGEIHIKGDNGEMTRVLAKDGQWWILNFADRSENTCVLWPFCYYVQGRKHLKKKNHATQFKVYGLHAHSRNSTWYLKRGSPFNLLV